VLNTSVVFVNSSKVKREFDPNNYTTKEEVLNALGDIRREPGSANTHLAIDELTLSGFSEVNGARKLTDGHPRVGILLTDSQSSCPNRTTLAAARARDSGIVLIVVGVGKEVDVNELKVIASNPTCQNLFLLNNVTELDSLKFLIRRRITEGMLVCFFVFFLS